MSEPIDWRTNLSAVDRYATIQALQESLSNNSMSEAMSIEAAAYTDSMSREAYNAACKPQDTVPPSLPSELAENEDSGVTIGGHANCRFISDGVTSEVYRTGENLALKVITSPNNMEPHNPQREIKVLNSLSHKNIIQLLNTFRDEQQRLVLVFPFMPLTLATLLEAGTPTKARTTTIFTDILNGLSYIHSIGIIHRDIKPSAILLKSADGPALLSDFGTAWHHEFSKSSEAPDNKILDIGTGPYRSPETLFVDKSYSTAVDMWSFGVMLAEAVTNPPKPPFESRPAHEDGNQLGLILSIFKTLGTPTPETWPEAKNFRVSPFEMWNVFPCRTWAEILPTIDPEFRDVITKTVTYGGRGTATDMLNHAPFSPK